MIVTNGNYTMKKLKAVPSNFWFKHYFITININLLTMILGLIIKVCYYIGFKKFIIISRLVL